MLWNYKLAQLKYKLAKLKPKTRVVKICILLILALASMVSFQNCNRTQFSAVGDQKANLASTLNNTEDLNCYLNGQIIPNGGYIDVYEASTVSNGSTCNLQRRNCVNGDLDGTFTSINCQVLPPQACVFEGFLDGAPYTTVVPHGGSIDAHQAGSVNAPATCDRQTRNCNDGILSGTYQHVNCTVIPEIPTPVTSKTIPVTGRNVSTPSAPIKIFLIVDFSPTMAQEIEKVKTAINNFVVATKGLYDFQLSVFSIDPVASVQGNRGALAAPSSEGIIRLADPVASLTAGPSTLLSDFDSQRVTFNQRIAAYAQQMVQQEVYIDESGLCQMVRLIKDSRYINSTDKVSFVIISDEDDSSHLKCVEKYNIQPTQQSESLYAFAQRSHFSINVVASGVKQVTSGGGGGEGGGGTPIVTENVPVSGHMWGTSQQCGFPLPYGVIADCDVESQNQCTEEMLQMIQNSPSMIGLVSVTNITSCSYSIHKQQDAIMSMDANAASVSLQDLVAQPSSLAFTSYGTSYSSLDSYMAINYSSYSDFTYNVQTSTFGGGSVAQLHEEFVGEGTFASKFNALVAQKLPGQNNVAVSTIVYGVNATCSVQNGSNGARYIDFINGVNPTGTNQLFRKESICQDNYTAVLANSGNLNMWTADLSYEILFANPDKIKSVSIVFQGQETILQSGVHYNLGPSGKEDGKYVIVFKQAAIPLLVQGALIKFHWD